MGESTNVNTVQGQALEGVQPFQLLGKDAFEALRFRFVSQQMDQFETMIDEKDAALKQSLTDELSRLQADVKTQQTAYQEQTNTKIDVIQAAGQQSILMQFITVGLLGILMIVVAILLVMQNKLSKALKTTREVTSGEHERELNEVVTMQRKLDELKGSVAHLGQLVQPSERKPYDGAYGGEQQMTQPAYTPVKHVVTIQERVYQAINRALGQEQTTRLYKSITDAMPEAIQQIRFLSRHEYTGTRYTGFMEEATNAEAGYIGIVDGNSLYAFPNRDDLNHSRYCLDEFFTWNVPCSNQRLIAKVLKPAVLQANGNLWHVVTKGIIAPR